MLYQRSTEVSGSTFKQPNRYVKLWVKLVTPLIKNFFWGTAFLMYRLMMYGRIVLGRLVSDRVFITLLGSLRSLHKKTTKKPNIDSFMMWLANEVNLMENRNILLLPSIPQLLGLWKRPWIAFVYEKTQKSNQHFCCDFALSEIVPFYFQSFPVNINAHKLADSGFLRIRNVTAVVPQAQIPSHGWV